MRATFTRFVVAVAVLAWSSSAAAQTVDEVIEKHLAALGGRAALAKLDSRFMVGTFTLSTPGGDVAGPIEVLNQRPNKARDADQPRLVGAGRRRGSHRSAI